MRSIAASEDDIGLTDTIPGAAFFNPLLLVNVIEVTGCRLPHC
jgi:hypothetical protein